ncbi:imidazole glycerol phosphate synthase subunit HisH [Candidatus Bathyarchaeota archaeon]|nr:imidazole glycerol phosphate synthase subunit HisH [Candidatus Bathyarchaeota archaeon]
MPQITIVDYGLGNLRSVEKAVEEVEGTPKISSDLQDLRTADGIILPGVGAFRDAQANLSRLTTTLLEQIDSGKPILGICLGLQLLFTQSTEGGEFKGLDIIKGRVIRFPQGVKVPHMGWNTLNIKRENLPLLEGISSNSYVYFVHSYYGVPQNESDIVAETEYGVSFPSIVARKEVFATQFHPEKSGANGLQILRNFTRNLKR